MLFIGKPLIELSQIMFAFKKALLFIHPDKLWGLCDMVGGLPTFQKTNQIFEVHKAALKSMGTPSLPATQRQSRANLASSSGRLNSRPNHGSPAQPPPGPTPASSIDGPAGAGDNS